MLGCFILFKGKQKKMLQLSILCLILSLILKKPSYLCEKGAIWHDVHFDYLFFVLKQLDPSP